MPYIETFTTAGPMSKCFPRLNGTLPLEDVHMHDLRLGRDSEAPHLVNKAEGLGLASAVGFLLPEES